MPPDFTSTITGIPAMVPSSNVQTGSGNSGKPQATRLPAHSDVIAAVREALEQIRENLANPQRLLEFHAEPGTGIVAVIVKDARTGQPIRQIPGHALVRLADLLTAADAEPPALVDLTA